MIVNLSRHTKSLPYVDASVRYSIIMNYNFTYIIISKLNFIYCYVI